MDRDGLLVLDETDFEPDAALAEFVERGAPPVVVTFGSMPALNARELTETIVQGITRAGARAILQSGIALLGEKLRLPETVHLLRYAPYDWLLQRAAGIVHHGGAGTCAAALRCGVPQAIVWHLGDQKTRGKLMNRRGVAPPAIFHRRFSSAWLADTVRHLSDGGLRSSARRLSDEIAREDGAGRAVEAVERSDGCFVSALSVAAPAETAPCLECP
jgi:sterol 3beta-glucosyltransferase